MLWRRIFYLLTCLLGIGFYIAHGEWLSWIILVCILSLPVISLLLSLPSMLLLKADFHCPDKVSMGTAVKFTPKYKCPLPMPPVQWRYTAYEHFTGAKLKLKGENSIIADHSGCITLCLTSAWKYDYLGLFRLRLCPKFQHKVLVLPDPVSCGDLPSLKRYLAGSWKPKPGGGFAENHDLREYRPGDDLRQIHWKLAAKTGKYILREPMIPVRGPMILAVHLKGESDHLDHILGKMVYTSHLLLHKDLAHEIHCMTGEGLLALPVKDEESFDLALTRILCSSQAKQDTMAMPKASWLYCPGGVLHEV